MIFEELDDVTRRYMLREFDVEEAGNRPYRGKGLSVIGVATVPGLIRTALATGTEASLAAAIAMFDFWNPTEP